MRNNTHHSLVEFDKASSGLSCLLQAAVGLLGLLTLGLIAGVIALGVKLKDGEGGDAGSGALLSQASTPPSSYRGGGAIDTAIGTWAPKASFPGADIDGIADGSVATFGTKVYHMGGHVGGRLGNNVIAATFIYDTLADGFTLGTDLPTKAARGGAAYDGAHTVYYAAGVRRAGDKPDEPEHIFGGPNTPCLFSLDVNATGASAKWQELPCMSKPRSDFCAAWAGGRLYIIGGMGKDNAVMDSIESFDPATKTWREERFTLPVGTMDIACAVLGDGTIYAVGGVDTKNFDSSPLTWFTAALWKVDVAKGSIEGKTALPRKRGDLVLAPLSDKLLLAVGGETTDGTRTQIGTHGAWIYSVETDAWVRSK
jgi:Kelch motif